MIGIIIALGILIAWIITDRQRVGEINYMRDQRNESEARADLRAGTIMELNQQINHLTRIIGAPSGVVFLPEKTFWQDLRDSQALCAKYAKLHQEKHQKLVTIAAYITDAESGPKIGQTYQVTPQACKPKEP